MTKTAKQAEQQWPADKVERWPINRLRENPSNPKLHSEAEVAETAAAIKQWGWTFPILTDETGLIIAGHRRHRAAKLLGFVEVPVMVARGWTDAMRRAYVIADNKHAERGKWDDTLLAMDVGVLNDDGFDIGLTGLTQSDLKRLAGDDDGDAVPVQEVATTMVKDEFWISIRGPLQHQAEMLQKMREVADSLDGVTVDLGVIAIG